MSIGHKRGFGRLSFGLLVIALVACNGNGTEPDIDEAFVGDWFVTSFVVDGVDLVTAPGSTLNVSFGFYSDGSYQLIVGGDTSGLLCDLAQSCNEQGDFSFSGNVITLDPGTADALDLQFTVSGDTLTISGTLDGTPFTASFERI